jgi:hypothetical protein
MRFLKKINNQESVEKRKDEIEKLMLKHRNIIKLSKELINDQFIAEINEKIYIYQYERKLKRI